MITGNGAPQTINSVLKKRNVLSWNYIISVAVKKVIDIIFEILKRIE